MTPQSRLKARIPPPRGAAQRRSRKRGGSCTRRRAAPRRELRPRGGQRSGEAASVGGSFGAAGPPQGANCAPAGGSAAAKPQAWGDQCTRRRAASRREFRPRGGQPAAKPQAWGIMRAPQSRPKGERLSAERKVRSPLGRLCGARMIPPRLRLRRCAAPRGADSRLGAARRRLHDPPTLAASPLRCPRGGGIRALGRPGGARMIPPRLRLRRCAAPAGAEFAP